MRASATGALCAALALLGACASTTAPEPVTEAFVPRLGGASEAVAASDPEELRRLGLVATNLVAALVQDPELRPAATTLQVNAPSSVFGNVLVRALEDAGYGLQRVSADQGRRFVSYGERYAVTESGATTDYTLSVGTTALSREYARRGENIYPSSLMAIDGIDTPVDMTLADAVFREQGDEDVAFISGVRDDEGIGDGGDVRTVEVRGFDAVPTERRTPLESVLAEVRDLDLAREAARDAPDLERFDRYRRAVLIFADPDTQLMGAANKRTVRLMARELLPGDVLAIRACHDADGQDEAAQAQAVRVAEELAGLDVPREARWIAPCVRASYRHASDTSPAPVELVHYRPKG